MPHDDAFRAVLRLCADYARLVDGRDGAGWSELFAPDGCLDLGRRKVAGRAALAEFAVRSAPGVHTPGLPTIAVDGDRVESESPFVFVNAANGQVVAGWYRDTLAWEGDRLVFVTRVVDRRATSPAPAS